MSNIEKSKNEELLASAPNINEIVKNLNADNIYLTIGDVVWSQYYGIGDVVRLTGDKLINIHNSDDKRLEDIGIEVKFREDGKITVYKLYDIKNKSIFKVINEESFFVDSEKLANGLITKEELISNTFPETPLSEERGLMTMNKDILIQKKNEMQRRIDFLTARGERAKVILEKRKNELYKIASEFQTIVTKLNRLIYTIELFLGMNEELHHIKQGLYSKNQPISLRQRRLYMDIEVGDPYEDLEGLDFNKIDDFDNWLLKYNDYWKMYNYEIMLPEEKGIVVFKVREYDKQYRVDNPFINKIMNIENHYTYLLIRNGENIFRIWGDLKIGEKLFPDSAELENLLKDKDNSNYRNTEKAEETIERYKLNMILIQGIIERTICFPEDQYTTSLFKYPVPEDKIKFIYDADKSKLLPAGIPTFKQWWNSKNSLNEGMRIYFNDTQLGYNTDWDDRYLKYYTDKNNLPSLPSSGVYIVNKHENKYHKDKFEYIIKFNDDSEYYSWSDGYKKRKNKVSFIIKQNDDFIIDYDGINRDDLKLLEFYAHTRIGREDYLWNIPTIIKLMETKKEEMKEEDDFITLVLKNSGLNPETDFQIGVDAVDWWKTKNKWKRFLNTDNIKAYRMILKKLKNNG